MHVQAMVGNLAQRRTHPTSPQTTDCQATVDAEPDGDLAEDSDDDENCVLTHLDETRSQMEVDFPSNPPNSNSVNHNADATVPQPTVAHKIAAADAEEGAEKMNCWATRNSSDKGRLD